MSYQPKPLAPWGKRLIVAGVVLFPINMYAAYRVWLWSNDIIATGIVVAFCTGLTAILVGFGIAFIMSDQGRLTEDHRNGAEKDSQ